MRLQQYRTTHGHFDLSIFDVQPRGALKWLYFLELPAIPKCISNCPNHAWDFFELLCNLEPSIRIKLSAFRRFRLFQATATWASER